MISRRVPIDKMRDADWFGAAASGLCALHCAVTPLFFVTRPVLESTVDFHHHGSGFWSLLDYVFLALSLIAVWYSARHTTHKGGRRLLWDAWVLFAVGLLSEVFHFHQGIWLMYIGSITLVVTHLYNHRYCRPASVAERKSKRNTV